MRKPVAFIAVLTLMLALPLMSQAAPPPGVTKAADLFAGQTTDVGDVFVWNDLTTYYVEIDLDDGWCMTESHVAMAAALTDIPQTSKGNPIPGQFPAGEDYSPCADGDTFTFAVADVGADPYIAVHVKAWEKQISTATIVSNAGDSIAHTTSYATFGGTAAALVPTFAGTGTWPALAGANYISNQFAGDPFNENHWRRVVETLDVPGLPVGDGQLRVNSDNYEFTLLNGLEIERDDASPTSMVENSAAEVITSPQAWATIQDVAFTPTMGANTFAFVFRNVAWGGGGDFADNPTGLIYKATVDYYAHSESAWAGTAVGVTPFPGKNWATYFRASFQPVLIQTVTVPATDLLGADSTALANGESFLFKVSGTVTWTNRGGADLVDAECTLEAGQSDWAQNAIGYPDDLLELQVNSTDVDWTPVGTANGAGCADGHEYTLGYTGAGAIVNFRIYDGTGNVQDLAWFGDNAGFLTVEIWQTTP